MQGPPRLRQEFVESCSKVARFNGGLGNACTSEALEATISTIDALERLPSASPDPDPTPPMRVRSNSMNQCSTASTSTTRCCGSGR